MSISIFRAAVFTAAFVLSGCGETDSDSNASDLPAPTSYYIRAVDLYRSIPNDICRTRDPAFIADLVARITRALPPGMQSSFAFEDFNVTDGYRGTGKEAILRFRVQAGKVRQLRYVVGDFAPETCALSRVRMGIGPSPYMDAQPPETPVP